MSSPSQLKQSLKLPKWYFKKLSRWFLFIQKLFIEHSLYNILVGNKEQTSTQKQVNILDFSCPMKK